MAIAIVMRAAEAKLVEALSAIRDPSGWQAVHFHLSDLLEQYKSEYQIKIAINLINDLIKSYDGGIYLMLDHSIVVLASGLDRPLLNKLIFQLRYLYMDDPLAYTDEGHENPNFCAIYDLSRDWQVFFDLCTRRMAVSTRKAATAAAPDQFSERGGVRRPSLETPALREAPVLAQTDALIGGGFSDRLSGIERDLRLADISHVLREQPVCTVASNLSVRHVFEEMYIHIAHLRQTLKTDVDFLSNRWLFKYLTHILDERILDLIGRDPARYLSHPISININVETILSSAFDAFDAAIRPQDKASVVLEVPVVDVFADIAAYEVVSREMKRRGYRLCLDGLTVSSFLNIDRSKLGFDLIKMQWNADMQSDLRSSRNVALAKAVQDCGSNRIILCRCDNRQAIDFGHALGISLFQGRFVDSLINPAAKVAN